MDGEALQRDVPGCGVAVVVAAQVRAEEGVGLAHEEDGIAQGVGIVSLDDAAAVAIGLEVQSLGDDHIQRGREGQAGALDGGVQIRALTPLVDHGGSGRRNGGGGSGRGRGRGGCRHGDESGSGIGAAVVVGIAAVDPPAVQRHGDVLQLHGAVHAVDDVQRGEVAGRGLIGHIGLPVGAAEVPHGPDGVRVFGDEVGGAALLHSLIRGGLFDDGQAAGRRRGRGRGCRGRRGCRGHHGQRAAVSGCGGHHGDLGGALGAAVFVQAHAVNKGVESPLGLGLIAPEELAPVQSEDAGAAGVDYLVALGPLLVEGLFDVNGVVIDDGLPLGVIAAGEIPAASGGSAAGPVNRDGGGLFIHCGQHDGAAVGDLFGIDALQGLHVEAILLGGLRLGGSAAGQQRHHADQAENQAKNAFSVHGYYLLLFSCSQKL